MTRFKRDDPVERGGIATDGSVRTRASGWLRSIGLERWCHAPRRNAPTHGQGDLEEMREMLGKSTRWRLGRRVALVAALAAASAAALGGAVPASATPLNKEEFLPFADCPLETAAVCVYSTTTGGEFKIVLQGGLATDNFTEQPLLGAADGNTLVKTPLEVPGGLVGVANIGGEVTATAELAGPPSSVKVDRANLLAETGTAVTLPIKVKLDNPLLGENCYVGSDEE